MYGIDLKANEEIRIVCYQSALLYTRSIVLALALLISTSYVLFWLLAQGLWGELVVGIGYILGGLLLIRFLVFWRGTKLVITTERVCDIYKKSLFQKEVTQLRMRDIDEVTGEIRGFWGTIFRLGHVRIQAKRGETVIRFSHIRHPLSIQDMILDRVEEIETDDVIAHMGEKEVLAYMETLGVQELDGLLRKAMQLLRQKKSS